MHIMCISKSSLPYLCSPGTGDVILPHSEVRAVAGQVQRRANGLAGVHTLVLRPVLETHHHAAAQCVVATAHSSVAAELPLMLAQINERHHHPTCRAFHQFCEQNMCMRQYFECTKRSRRVLRSWKAYLAAGPPWRSSGPCASRPRTRT